MHIAVIASIAHASPPRAYGPWELIAWLVAEGLAERGHDVTLFATANSATQARLDARIPAGYEEATDIDGGVATILHAAHAMESTIDFDIVSNHFDFTPVAFARMTPTPIVTTIHGFSNEEVTEVYREYDRDAHYIAISDADRHPDLSYVATIHHGIPVHRIPQGDGDGGYLVAVGRIHPDKGTREAIAIAHRAGLPLFIAGIIHDQAYYDECVAPFVDGHAVHYLGNLTPPHRDRLVGGAKAMVHPIGFDEPFGLAVVESLAAGTPVVAFRRGSMPELLTSGETGFLVDDVEQAVDAVGLIDTLDRNSCRNVAEQRFTIDRMIDDYERVFRNILADATTPATVRRARTTGSRR